MSSPVTLVIGCGNDLRGDDRVGRLVADRIAELDLPAVRVRSVTQLVPELAIDVADADRVVIVDADVGAESVGATTLDVDSRAPSGPGLNHHLGPKELIELATTAGHRPTPVVQVSVPARRLDVGFDLSPDAHRGVEDAVHLVLELIEAPLATR